jgi:hypothetical protein
MRDTNPAGGVCVSLTKKAYSLRASRGPVSGCRAIALMKSMPSCSVAARAGMVVVPSG